MLKKTAPPRFYRHRRIRSKIVGTSERPRLCVFRSLKHIYGQLIDDEKGHTILTVSSLAKELKGDSRQGNIKEAQAVGTLLAAKAREKGIEKVVFDRGGYLYHGRVKALAEAAREGGLKF
jgi:large subunit ribosomal protein L18